jgi:lycopene beta-cyclase
VPRLRQEPNIDWIEDEIQSLEHGDTIVLRAKEKEYLAYKVFDSRPPRLKSSKKYPLILQHFKGNVICTEEAFFNPTRFVMMDFSIGYRDHCCFTYVLPTSTHKALIEFTFFSPQLVDQRVYQELIDAYLKKHGIITAEVVEEEDGVIPRSAYPCWNGNRDNYMGIGTGGGWVKASSGYSFKMTEKKVAEILHLLMTEQPLNQLQKSRRHNWYDDLFLRVLHQENHLGNQLFSEMYSRNTIQDIFNFLDEESSFSKELSIINKFSKAPFYRALWRKFFG